MPKSNIQAHISAINDCNQRGGRMLSLIDLIDAGTVDLPLAAYLAAVMRTGASLLVGARPGGAGKTAVMCALLNFLPDHTAIRVVDHPKVLMSGKRDTYPGDTCYLAHEIGSGSYYAYVWGNEARAFFSLAAQGHIIASNLHADTLEQTQDQLCLENGVEQFHLDAVNLKVYIKTELTGGWNMQRWISMVYESDGSQDRLVWQGIRPEVFNRKAAGESVIVSPEQEKMYAKFLSMLQSKNIRRIEEVRRMLLNLSA